MSHPAGCSKSAFAAMELTWAEFAEKCDLPQELIRGIIDREAPIELATAVRFQSVLGVDAEL